MTRRILLLVFLALQLTGADITGKWTFQVDLGGQSGSPKFTFQQKGETLTGTYSGQLGESTLKGTVTSDTEMKGKTDYGGQAEGTWTAKKN